MPNVSTQAPLALLLTIFIIGSAGIGSASTALEVEDSAPLFSLPDSSGDETSLASLRGKVVLLNFWASWCGPCISELPLLDELQERHAAAGLVVIGVNIDSHEAPARGVTQRLNLSLPVLFDPRSEAVQAYAPPALPTTYILDGNGIIKHIEVGEIERGELPELEARLTALFNAAPVPSAQSPGHEASAGGSRPQPNTAATP